MKNSNFFWSSRFFLTVALIFSAFLIFSCENDVVNDEQLPFSFEQPTYYCVVGQTLKLKLNSQITTVFDTDSYGVEKILANEVPANKDGSAIIFAEPENVGILSENKGNFSFTATNTGVCKAWIKQALDLRGEVFETAECKIIVVGIIVKGYYGYIDYSNDENNLYYNVERSILDTMKTRPVTAEFLPKGKGKDGISYNFASDVSYTFDNSVISLQNVNNPNISDNNEKYIEIANNIHDTLQSVYLTISPIYTADCPADVKKLETATRIRFALK